MIKNDLDLIDSVFMNDTPYAFPITGHFMFKGRGVKKIWAVGHKGGLTMPGGMGRICCDEREAIQG